MPTNDVLAAPLPHLVLAQGGGSKTRLASPTLPNYLPTHVCSVQVRTGCCANIKSPHRQLLSRR